MICEVVPMIIQFNPPLPMATPKGEGCGASLRFRPSLAHKSE
jgi:hypothetical protein